MQHREAAGTVLCKSTPHFLFDDVSPETASGGTEMGVKIVVTPKWTLDISH